MMKKILCFCMLLGMMLIICVSIGYSETESYVSEVNDDNGKQSDDSTFSKFDNYIRALTDNTWTMTSFLAGKDVTGNLGIISDFYRTIGLPNEEIRLFENANGQIYITFSLSSISSFKEMVIAEIMFDHEMTSFILYSGDCALLYEIVQQ